MNSINLIGRIATDIRYNETETKKWVLFTVAVRKSKDNADFFQCIAFDRTAELLANFCEKGDQVGLTGRLETYKYTKDDSAGNLIELERHRVNVLIVSLISKGRSEPEPEDTPAADPFSY